LNPPRKLPEAFLLIGTVFLATTPPSWAEVPRSPFELGEDQFPSVPQGDEVDSAGTIKPHSSFHDHPADPSMVGLTVAAGIDTLGPVRWSLLKKSAATSVIDQQNWSQTASLGLEWDSAWGAVTSGVLLRRFPEHIRTAPAEMQELGQTFKSNTSGEGRGVWIGWRFGPRMAQTPWVSWIRLVYERNLARASVFFEDNAEVQKLSIASNLEILYARIGVDVTAFGHGKAGLSWGVHACAPLLDRLEKKSGIVSEQEQALHRELGHRSAAALGLQISATIAH
jgi:hypothetical protein